MVLFLQYLTACFILISTINILPVYPLNLAHLSPSQVEPPCPSHTSCQIVLCSMPVGVFFFFFGLFSCDRPFPDSDFNNCGFYEWDYFPVDYVLFGFTLCSVSPSLCKLFKPLIKTPPWTFFTPGAALGSCLKHWRKGDPLPRGYRITSG